MDELANVKKENSELKILNATKSDWISISAHELRTSLAANKWMLKMFLDKDFGSITPEQEGFMRKAFIATERMLSLVNDMLTVNHSQDATLEYTFENDDIIELIENTLFDFQGEAFKKGIELIFLKPTPLPAPVRIDKDKIRVVIQNLIENAIKYSDSGSKIIISMVVTEQDIQVSVKDRGIGIPAAENGRIFEKFFRATNAKERSEVGSGLGLYVIKKIITEHKGDLRFESAPDAGTTFTFTLPYGNTPNVEK